MKSFLQVVISLLLLHSASMNDVCKTTLMQGYLLEGQRAASSEQMPLCLSITKNCCTIADSVKVFNEVATNMDPMIQSYRVRMQKAIESIVLFNGAIQKLKFPGASSDAQASFCANAETQFRAIVFEPIADALRMGYERAFLESRDYHLSFYCAICDFKAQQSIDTAKKAVTLHPRTCMRRIINNRRYLRALNVDLINYFQAAQKFLDCVAYDNFFDFPFLYKEQGAAALTAGRCFDKVTSDPDNMPAECVSFCGSMNIAGISSNLEGDGDFLQDIVSYYRGLVDSTVRRIEITPNTFKPFDALNNFQIELTDNKERRLSKSMLLPGRILQAAAPAAPKSGPPPANASMDVVEAYYNSYYEDITFETNPNSKEVLKLQTDPYNVGQFTLSFSADNTALDLTAYFNGLNFDVNKTELTKLTLVDPLKPVVVNPYIEALCALGAKEATDSFAADIALKIVLKVPDAYVSDNEKAIDAAATIPFEAAEIVDSDDAAVALKKEKDANDAAAKAAGKNADVSPKSTTSRRLRKSRGYHQQKHHRKVHKATKSRHYKSNGHMSRNRKLESLYDFGDD